MFYIEKNDKLSFFEKTFNILKIVDNKILLPFTEKTSEKQMEKMAIRTNNKIEKNSNSKKVVLSKEIKKCDLYVNYLNSFGIQIADGRFLFEILIPNIIEYIVEKKKIEKPSISILINDLTDLEYQNILILSKKYKIINIVTNHIEKFKKLENKLDEEGIIITVTNNKKKSLLKSNIIINVDFTQELINKYNLKEDSIIINIKNKTKIAKKRFNGITINDYEIDFRDDKKENYLNNRYYLKDLYEAGLYRRQKISDIVKKIELDKVVIKKLILNNGEI